MTDKKISFVEQLKLTDELHGALLKHTSLDFEVSLDFSFLLAGVGLSKNDIINGTEIYKVLFSLFQNDIIKYDTPTEAFCLGLDIDEKLKNGKSWEEISKEFIQ